MNIIKFTSPGRDLFDRKHPIQIKFKDGNILFGHVKSSYQIGDKTTNIHFELIQNIDDWCRNIIEENREIIVFDDDAIEEISNYRCNECHFYQAEYDSWSLNQPVNSINRANAPFLNNKEKSLIEKVNPTRILDIGCGNGVRLFSFLEKKKIDFIGLEKFERLVNESSFRDKIIIADLLTINTADFIAQNNNIDTITILGGSLLGIFCLENQIQAWEKIIQILPIGGKIIFDALIVDEFESSTKIGSKKINPQFPPQYFLAEIQLKEIWNQKGIDIIEYSDFEINPQFKIRYYLLQKN